MCTLLVHLFLDFVKMTSPLSDVKVTISLDSFPIRILGRLCGAKIIFYLFRFLFPHIHHHHILWKESIPKMQLPFV